LPTTAAGRAGARAVAIGYRASSGVRRRSE
jgi:hypothetical protein